MMLITNRETMASVALLVLAGVFLYLGFSQVDSPWAQLAQSQSPKIVETGTTAAPSPASPAPSTSTDSASKDSGAAPLRQADSPSLPGAAQDPLQGPLTDTLKEKTGAEFFIEYRLERDRVRSQEIQMLREVVNNTNSTAELRQEAQQRMISIVQFMEQEMQLEALLKAKGFAEAVVFMQPAAVNVVVRSAQLKDDEVQRIGEMVARTANRKMDEVVITPWP